jgi:predicted PurR-regulated permease PerM
LQQNKWFRFGAGLIMVLTIIYLLSLVRFMFSPILSMLDLLIVPLALSGLFYYLLRPVIRYLDKRRVNRTASVLLVYFVIAAMIVVFTIAVWPSLQKQIKDFIDNIPNLLESMQEQITALQQNRYLASRFPNMPDFSDRISEYLNKGFTAASKYFSGVLAFVTSFVIVIGTVPVLLFYLLKESDKLAPAVSFWIPERFRRDGLEVMHEIDVALSGYVSGRMISAAILTVMTFTGYLLIGLPYPLLLAIVSSLFCFIPYVGPFLGAIPSVIVAFTVSPSLVLWVLVVNVIAQQIDDNLISPLVYSKTIDIHPLMTIILLLVAGDFYGILGMILALPVYMVAKIIIQRVYRLVLLNKVRTNTDQTIHRPPL